MLRFYPQNTLFFEQIGLILTIINKVIINMIIIDIIIIILFYYNIIITFIIKLDCFLYSYIKSKNPLFLSPS